MKTIKSDITVEIKNVALPFSEDEIKNIFEEMLSFAVTNLFVSDKFYSLDFGNYCFGVDILFCDNNFIHSVNQEYRKIDAPTDVISFALFADSEARVIFDNYVNLGQIIISTEKAAAQANEYNTTLEKEIINLLSHGILHLLGIDHKDEESLISMLKKQEKMIKAVENVKI